MRRNTYYRPRSVRRAESRVRRNLFLTIVIVIVLAYASLTWAIPTLIGSLSVLNRFKSSPKTVKTEAGVAVPPPVLNIPFESTNSARISITGYTSPNSKVEIYIDEELKDSPTSNDEGQFTTSDIELNMGTNNITGITLTDDNKKSLPSKNIRVFYSNEKPKLELSEPADNQTIQGGDKKVRVSGKTDSGNSVSVNGSTTIVDPDGNFSIILNINEGENTISVTASNTFSNSTSLQRKVTYTP